MFIGVLVTEKHGKLFVRELKECNVDSMIIGGEIVCIFRQN